MWWVGYCMVWMYVESRLLHITFFDNNVLLTQLDVHCDVAFERPWRWMEWLAEDVGHQAKSIHTEPELIGKFVLCIPVRHVYVSFTEFVWHLMKPLGEDCNVTLIQPVCVSGTIVYTFLLHILPKNLDYWLFPTSLLLSVNFYVAESLEFLMFRL
jgi:hypothetical protein